MPDREKILILGIGNPLLTDDGAGLQVAATLREILNRPDITVLETATAGLALLDFLAGYDEAIIIDAIQTVGGTPGHIYKLTPEAFDTAEHITSPHGIDFRTALELGSRLGLDLPRKITIYAIEAADVSSFGEEFTPPVRKAVSACVNMILQELQEDRVDNLGSSLDAHKIGQLIELALQEDLGYGDITTDSLIPESERGNASIIAKAEGIIAGTEVARQVFLRVDPELNVEIIIEDGTKVKPGDVIARVQGRISSILKAERLALNFLQHLSGIATETARYVKAVNGLPVSITDTRKTIPGLRLLEKYAVRVGGGKNHRMHLGDSVLIKDNHLMVLRRSGKSIKEIIAQARHKVPPGTKVEIEVKTPEEACEAAEAGADIIMLDNMSLESMRRSVQLIKGRTLVEASGGITLERVRAVAETGVDMISVGALTHSARALDISLELD